MGHFDFVHVLMAMLAGVTILELYRFVGTGYQAMQLHVYMSQLLQLFLSVHDVFI